MPAASAGGTGHPAGDSECGRYYRITRVVVCEALRKGGMVGSAKEPEKGLRAAREGEQECDERDLNASHLWAAREGEKEGASAFSTCCPHKLCGSGGLRASTREMHKRSVSGALADHCTRWEIRLPKTPVLSRRNAFIVASLVPQDLGSTFRSDTPRAASGSRQDAKWGMHWWGKRAGGSERGCWGKLLSCIGANLLSSLLLRDGADIHREASKFQHQGGVESFGLLGIFRVICR